MRLYLVRHGRTPSNVARLLDTAVPGADLDPVGREQAAALVERLAGHPVDALYASDLVRTQQTVAPLARERGLEVTVLGGLREIQAGEDEMSPDWRRYVETLQRWAEDPTASVPGGEDGEGFLSRYDAAVAQAAASGHDSAVLVSHGAAMRLWLAFRATGVPAEELVGRRLGNTTVVTLEGDTKQGWRIIDWEEAPEDSEHAVPAPDPRLGLTRGEASASAPGWRVLLGRLHLTTAWPSFADALAFVTAVGELAERSDHHPEIDLRFDRVHLTLTSHDVGTLTARDTELANRISVLVHERLGRPVPAELGVVEIAIDTLDAAAIAPFWAAVLGYEQQGDELVDPRGIGPTVWFQQVAEPNPGRNRLHLDVTVAHDEADARIAAAVAAGGRVVSADRAPAFTVLADADGNEACVCTWQGRD